MPMSVTTTDALGTGYIDIRRSAGGHGIHQIKLDVSAFTGAVDANNTLPPGLPIKLSAGVGVPVTGTTDVVAGIIGPEPVHLEADDHFGNIIESGDLAYDAIKANLGRVWDANELASVALVGALRVL
jgi:hypothetical protein